MVMCWIYFSDWLYVPEVDQILRPKTSDKRVSEYFRRF